MSDDYNPAKDGHDRLAYDPHTGVLSWRHAPNASKSWNTRYAGKPVGHINVHGYRVFHFGGRVLYAHRVAWNIVHGTEAREIDHINGDRADNRLVNLREVDPQANRRNAARSSNNTSGETGIAWIAARQRWRAFITVDRRHVSLGAFKEKADAIAARKAAEAAHGFHPNHGRAGS